jgi:quaternary ammonium compound-resistance protein SugE
MAWFYLFIAGCCEIGWPLGLKLSQTNSSYKYAWIALAVASMALSGFFLWIAQKTIPMGTAYAIWTGIGAIGAFIVGILMFNDPASFFRIASATLIVAGIVGLRLAS